jgi:alkylhydroperoxidase/carboxymuconolactone decarboxylase family protein YurZ
MALRDCLSPLFANAIPEHSMTISNAFQTFLSEAPAHAEAWMNAVRGLDQASALDKKTEELAYIAVLAALRLTSGIPFHVKSAKLKGATREEIISAVLVGLPAAGNAVIGSLPAALEAFDEQDQ